MFAGRLGTGGTLLVAALAAGACGGGDDSGSTDLTPAQAETVGQAAADQVGGLAAGLTHFTTPGVGGLGAGFFSADAPGGAVVVRTLGRLHPAVAAGLGRIRAGDCTPTQSDSTDTDHDGIPDNNTISFTAGNCSFDDTTDVGMPVTIAVSGTVQLLDTDGATVFYGYHVGVASLTVTVTDTSGNTVAAGLNGTLDASVAGDQATTSENLTSGLRLNGSKLYGDHTSLVVSYIPTGGTISPSAMQLPAGNLTLTGGYAWAGQLGSVKGDWSFVLDTPTPLSYDGSCDDDQYVFGSGQLKGAINLRRTIGFEVDYSGCGVPPTVTVFRPTA